MATCFQTLVQCCVEGGTLQKYHLGMWQCSQWMDHIGFATVQGSMCFLGLHYSRLQAALQRHCPKLQLCFMHFPGLSHSSLGCSTRTQTWMGFVFLSLPGSENSGDQLLGEETILVGNASFNLLGLGPSVSQVYCKSTVPGVPRVTYRG